MQKKLPARANLEHLKAQAKDLLGAFRRKDAAAIERFRETLPAARGRDSDEIAALELALHDAQSVIAREYGFESWASLRAHVQIAGESLSPETLRALMNSPLPPEVDQALVQAISSEMQQEVSLASALPLLPLRNAVLSVGSVAPLSIGRPASLSAVAAARKGAGAVAVFAQKEDTNEAPTERDLHPVGCAARLCSVMDVPERGTWIVVRAVEWIRLEAIERTTPYLTARATRFAIRENDDARQVAKLEAGLRERVQTLAARLPQPELVLRMVERMSPLELADATIANLPCSVQEKARYASEPSLVGRLEYVLSLIERAA